jgi:hypothetical protein
MKNEKKYPNGYQPKLDYWLDVHMELMEDMRNDIYRPDQECFMQSLEYVNGRIRYFFERQEEWKKEQWIKDWDDAMSLFK